MQRRMSWPGVLDHSPIAVGTECPRSVKLFADITIREHLQKRHFRGNDWIRCSNCRQSFPHAELTAHLAQACESSPHPEAYEDGFDVFQERELKPKRLKPKNFVSEGSRWREIFQVVFPDWQGEVPSPCKSCIPIIPVAFL